MSRRQCCVWGCHNRKGRCLENIKGERICGCPDLRSTGCPKSRELLPLHYIQKMPDQVKKLTASKINKNRQSSGGGLWVPSDESCICNMHYEDFKGPSRWKINLVPRYFKRPHEFDHEKSVERRVLVHNALEPVDQAIGSSKDVPSTKSLMCDATTQCNEEVHNLKEKIPSGPVKYTDSSKT